MLSWYSLMVIFKSALFDTQFYSGHAVLEIYVFHLCEGYNWVLPVRNAMKFMNV